MNLRDHLLTSEPAEFLGVSPGTVRNWVGQGKLEARRLPQNGYRLVQKGDLEAVLRSVQAPRPQGTKDAQGGARMGRRTWGRQAR
jgi:predicted transcriptional regulator